MVMAPAEKGNQSGSKKRRARRKKLKLAVQATNTFFENYFKSIGISSTEHSDNINLNSAQKELFSNPVPSVENSESPCYAKASLPVSIETGKTSKMSSKDTSSQSRDEVKAAREAKKLAKQKAKNKGDAQNVDKLIETKHPKSDIDKSRATKKPEDSTETQNKVTPECVDEVDRATVKLDAVKIEETPKESKEQILIERAAKKAAKQAKKKGESDPKPSSDMAKKDVKNLESNPDMTKRDIGDLKSNPEMTVMDVVETLKDIKQVAKDVQDLTAKVSAISFEAKDADSAKSKADLKAERRAKQEAQRAAKQAAVEQKAAQVKAKPAPETKKEVAVTKDVPKEKSPKPKTDKPKPKPQSNWFQHLHTQLDKDALNKIPINSNLHPAIIKLGVRLATRVVTGSNARCVATLDALKQMVRDYTLPAKTEFARGLEPALAASLQFLWAMRQPTASQTNAVKYFRHHLTQLPNNVDEFDAKKKLQEEIDKYIEDQIDKAGEAISEAVRPKIAAGDNILTYGCSSLIERVLREAWEAGVEFRTVVVGNRVHNGAREMLRRLTVAGLRCTYADITAISYVMKSINKVILGASSLLVNGSVLGAVGTAQVALAAKECNVPLLVACETHKFSEKVQTDAFVFNELGDPDLLLSHCDGAPSPLREWRAAPNLTLLNLSYDVTPPSLVTAVVTEKAILPCTSAPVVLRTKLSEYGM